MKTHLSDIEIEAYRRRTASPEQLLAYNDHIFECDRCYRLVESPEKIEAAYVAMKKYLEDPLLFIGDEHLKYSQVEGYVDGTLDSKTREAVSHHIAGCPECEEEVKDIAVIKARLEVEGNYQPAPAKQKRSATFLRMPGYRLELGVALFVVVIGSLFWVYAHRLNSRIAALERRRDQLEQENKDLRRKIEAISPKRPAGTPPSLKDGNRQITIDEKGELLAFDGLPANYRDALKDALTTGRIVMPPPPETTLGQQGSLLGIRPAGGSFEALWPASTAVEDTRPVFEWQPLAGATRYKVFVKDLATGLEIEGQPSGRTTWRPENPLARGHQYAWMVQATIDGRLVRAPAPEKPYATFRVLDEQQAQEVSVARKEWGSSHLVMGLVYAKAGLIREAEKEFRELVAENPESSTARSLLVSVETIRGRRR